MAAKPTISQDLRRGLELAFGQQGGNRLEEMVSILERALELEDITQTTATFSQKILKLNDGGTTANLLDSGISWLGDSGLEVGYLRVSDTDTAELEMKAPTGSELTFDINADVTFAISANLTVSGPSFTNQDTRTTADPTFGTVQAVAFTGQTEADSAILKSADRTVAGANAALVTMVGGKGGDDPADNGAGGVGGFATLTSGKGGDALGLNGVGGRGADFQINSGSGGDTDLGTGAGGDGGDVILNVGAGGDGDTPGKKGFIVFEDFTKFSAETGLVANPGGGQANAASLTSTNNKATTVASAGDSFILPKAEEGMTITFRNSAAVNSADLFPVVDDDEINALGANTAFAVAAGSLVTFICYENDKWDTN